MSEREDGVLQVLITIDTEVYPLLPGWRDDGLRRDIDRDIYGLTPEGEVGLRHQVETFARHGIKAVFFVESLFAYFAGPGPLREMVGLIQGAGHEVQLHLHPEWLQWVDDPIMAFEGRETIREYSADEQSRLVGAALHNLRAAGAVDVCAFRAGDFAAGSDTLDALVRNGLRFDTSLNHHYPASLPELGARRRETQPFAVGGLTELPVSYWHTPPMGSRPAQLTSASFAEMKASLLHAHREGWAAFTIVSHSFELLRARRRNPARPVADPVAVSRLERLCEFLQRNPDMFRTCGFNDLRLPAPHAAPKPALRSPLLRTLARQAVQARRRLARA